MVLNYVIISNISSKILKKFLQLLKISIIVGSWTKLLKKYWKLILLKAIKQNYWKILKINVIEGYWKNYWKILILIEPSIQKFLTIEHYWKINNIFSLLYCIVLYCIEPRRRCLVFGSDPGANFTNILKAAFTCTDPKKAQKR